MIAEAVDLLLQLQEPPQVLCQQYLDKWAHSLINGPMCCLIKCVGELTEYKTNHLSKILFYSSSRRQLESDLVKVEVSANVCITMTIILVDIIFHFRSHCLVMVLKMKRMALFWWVEFSSSFCYRLYRMRWSLWAWSVTVSLATWVLLFSRALTCLLEERGNISFVFFSSSPLLLFSTDMAVVSRESLISFVQELMNRCSTVIHEKLTLEVIHIVFTVYCLIQSRFLCLILG